MKADKDSVQSVEMTDLHTAAPPVRVATAAPQAAATTTTAVPEFASLPASPFYAHREEVLASAAYMEGGAAQTDGLRIRVWYLDDVFTRAEPKFVPDVATLKQLLPERDLSFPSPASPLTAGDHFAKVPYTHAASPRPPPPAASNPTLDATNLVSLPSISLYPASPTRPGGHAAWVSVKAPSRSELIEILDWLPIHVLTRRRILEVLCDHSETAKAEERGEEADARFSRSASKLKKTSRLSRRSERGNEPTRTSGEEEEETSDDDDGESHGPHNTPGDNFLEYFPAHGYAVLCLQAVPLPKGESTRRGATPKEEVITHRTQVPSTPVVALAFESTLFTFSLSRFGGEGDVRLIVANHVSSPTAHSARHGMPARVTTIATLSSTATLHEQDRSARNASPRSAGAGDTAIDATVPVFNSSISPVETVAHFTRNGGTTTTAAATATREANNTSPPPLSFPPQTSASSPSRFTDTPTTVSGSSWGAATAISVVCSSLISAIIAYLQQSTRALLIEADQLDELVLQILPSRVDQDDMLVRTKSIRHFIAVFHIDALQKERVLKQLLLPAMRQTPLAQSTQAIERYQRSLSSVRSTILKLRKGRDIVNRASMTLVSGVSARLFSHCNFMDYLNHVQTQIAVVVMPIAVIPGVFAMNVSVPWQQSSSIVPFYVILSITMTLMIIGLAPPLYKFYLYSTPKALAPLE